MPATPFTAWPRMASTTCGAMPRSLFRRVEIVLRKSCNVQRGISSATPAAARFCGSYHRGRPSPGRKCRRRPPIGSEKKLALAAIGLPAPRLRLQDVGHLRSDRDSARACVLHALGRQIDYHLVEVDLRPLQMADLISTQAGSISSRAIVPNWVAAAPVSSPVARQISASSASRARGRASVRRRFVTYSAAFASRMPSPASQSKYADIDRSVWSR